MASTAPINVRQLRPPVVTFKPSMWGHIFNTFSFDHQVQEKYSEQMEALKKEARSMLMAAPSTKQLLTLIDKVERLGLAYHFESEIEDKLRNVFKQGEEDDGDVNGDFFTTALRFRLLRQHQYHVSCRMSIN